MKNFSNYVFEGLDLPVFENVSTQTMDCDNDTVMIYTSCTSVEAFKAYCAKLEQAGFEKAFERSEFGNEFCALTRNDRYVYTYFSRYLSAVRIVTGPVEMLGLQDCSDGREEKYAPKLVTLGQRLTINCGQGYVFLLPDGRFIVHDGGCRFEDGRDFVYDALKSIAPDPDNMVIAAWVITHPHGDHQEAFEDFARDHGEDVVIQKMIFNYSAAKAHIMAREDGSRDDCEALVHTMYEICSEYLPDTQVVKAHTGQIFNFGSVNMEVLYTIEDFFPGFGIDYTNASSIVVRITIAGQTFMILGDTTHNSGRVLERTWKEYLKSDVMQIAHHGLWPSNSSLYKKYLQSEIMLWPTHAKDAKWALAQDFADANRAALEFAKDVYLSGNDNVIYDLPLVVKNNKDEVLEAIANSN